MPGVHKLSKLLSFRNKGGFQIIKVYGEFEVESAGKLHKKTIKYLMETCQHHTPSRDLGTGKQSKCHT